MSAKPPDIHACAAEQALLGAVINGAVKWTAISGRLAAADFYDKRNQTIFTAAEAIAASGYQPDPALLLQHLKDHKALKKSGGEEYFADLAGIGGTAVNAQGYIGQIRNTALLRNIFTEAADASAAATHPEGKSPAQIAAAFGDKLRNIALLATPLNFQSHAEVITQWEERDKNNETTRTGIRLLTDALGGGIHNGFITLVGGAPHAGKTTLAMQLANQADHALIIALDSPPRFCATIIGKEPHANIQYADKSENAASIAAEAIGWNAQHPPDSRRVIVIDYVQRIASGEDTRNQHADLQATMRHIRNLTRETNAAVIVCVAISKPDRKIGKPAPPALSSLRDSSSLEYDSDVVLLLHAPEPKKHPTKREIIIVKNRATGIMTSIEVWLNEKRRLVLAESETRTIKIRTTSSDEFLRLCSEQEKKGARKITDTSKKLPDGRTEFFAEYDPANEF